MPTLGVAEFERFFRAAAHLEVDENAHWERAFKVFDELV
jgi:hypothetical protein